MVRLSGLTAQTLKKIEIMKFEKAGWGEEQLLRYYKTFDTSARS
jgi:hypothetical protein